MNATNELNNPVLIPENIPEELKALNQWVVYRIEEINGRLTKPPYQTNGKKASTTDPETCCTFEQALEAFQEKNFDGIGFVFTKDDPYTGIDLDDCVNPETKAIESWAMDWINRFSSYTEFSPSKTGTHTIVKGELPCEKGIKKGDYEIYDHARYFTFTGDVIVPKYSHIEERQNVVEELCQFLHGSSKKDEAVAPLPEGDELSNTEINEIINKARAAKTAKKFSKLYEGSWDELGYPSQSEADQALCNHLAYWANYNPTGIDQIFRESGLYREKWERDDYRENTIKKALSLRHQKAKSDFKEQEDSSEIILLDEYVIPSTQFPISTLPAVGQEIVRAVAEVNQVDLALAGSAYLAVLSTCLMGKAVVDLQSHFEPINIYLCSVLPSGERKSATMKILVNPIHSHEKINNELLLVNDITTESLEEQMGKHNSKMGIISAEGGLFEIMSGARYNKNGTGNFDLYLCSYTGEAYKVHRKNRKDSSVLLYDPLLSLYFSVQPIILKQIGQNENFKGRGLIGRFLFSICKPMAGNRKIVRKKIPLSIIERYHKHVEDLLLIDNKNPSNEAIVDGNPILPQDINNDGERNVIEFVLTEDAQKQWEIYSENNECELKDGELLCDVKEWGNRLPGNVGRLAGLLHFAVFGDKADDHKISIETLFNAISLVDYYKSHSLSAFKIMNFGNDENHKYALLILDYLKKKLPKDQKNLTIRGLYRIGHARLKNMGNVKRGLSLLEERNYLKVVKGTITISEKWLRK